MPNSIDDPISPNAKYPEYCGYCVAHWLNDAERVPASIPAATVDSQFAMDPHHTPARGPIALPTTGAPALPIPRVNAAPAIASPSRPDQ